MKIKTVTFCQGNFKIRWSIFSIVVVTGLLFCYGDSPSFFHQKTSRLKNSKMLELKKAVQDMQAATNDLQKYMSEYRQISISPRYSQTNVTTYSRKFVCTNIVKKSRSPQEIKYLRLMTILDNKTMAKIYYDRMGILFSDIKESIQEELSIAKSSFDQTMKDFNEAKQQYATSLRQLESKRRQEHKTKIDLLKKEIFKFECKVRHCKNNSNLGRCNCSSCSRTIHDIDKLKLELKTLEHIYDNNKWSDGRESLLNRKLESNDQKLAQADYRDQIQNIYMAYNQQIIGDFKNKMLAIVDESSRKIKNLYAEIEQLAIIDDHPDLIRQEYIDEIVSKDVQKILQDQFGVDAAKIDERLKVEEKEQLQLKAMTNAAKIEAEVRKYEIDREIDLVRAKNRYEVIITNNIVNTPLNQND